MAIEDLSIFRNKRVLVTGHTGFKGAWLSIWLEQLGAHVIGMALDPTDNEGVFNSSGIGERITDHRQDIRDLAGTMRLFRVESPEIVLHLAAQAVVLESYRTPVDTFATNVMGTAHVLEAIRHTPSVKAAVIVTTDKCYENNEWVHGYRETDALGGHDPYSASKGAAEIVTSSYRRSYFSASGAPAVATARSGNVIGGGDRTADRLVPDLFRAVQADRPLVIRNPGSVRPWQHVLEPLHGYLLLAKRLLEDPERFVGAWNFGPLPTDVHTVRQLADAIIHHIGKGVWKEDGSTDAVHEATLLMLDISKAVHLLGWAPRLSFQQTVQLTADWYMAADERDVLELCQEQIERFRTSEDHQG